MHRLPGVALSLVIHIAVLVLWWHPTGVRGSSPVFANAGAHSDTDQAQRIDVRLIAVALPITERAPLTTRRVASDEKLREQRRIETAAYLPPVPIFYGPGEVDKDALPYSAPDPDLLAGVVASGLPIRVRLYIDANGVVTGVEKLQALADDQQAFERIERMLRGTAFMPAKLAGNDVNSYQDLEFFIGPELNKTGVVE